MNQTLLAVALCALRLVPIAFLCPLLGGPAAPSWVRLSTAGALAFFVASAGGGTLPPGAWEPWTLARLAARELALGVGMGLLAALPFEAARTGGRLVDLFRGASAEAALPFSGSREAASGEALFQLLLGLALTSAAGPLVLGALLRSFLLFPLGSFAPSAGTLGLLVKACAGALAVGLAIGAPTAAVSLGLDALLALGSRAAPELSLQDLGAPARILGGGALLWLGLGVLADRMVSEVLRVDELLHSLAEVAR